MREVEEITGSGRLLVVIVGSEFRPSTTSFITDDSLLQQVGMVVYPAGGEVKRHFHRPLERHIVGTPEVLVIRSGRCEIDVYDDQRERVATRELHGGDVVILVSGGHGFRMLEDTALLEVKQGPYTGIDEKELF
jgi:hypothetical protein